MSEYPILITNINDFIFCPVSIYFHSLDGSTEKLIYQDFFQLNGTAAHEKSDNGEYSDRKDILQAIDVYSSEYNLIGKIDTFDISLGRLTERKKHISVIYDGYVFQLYAQYFALVDMGYAVNEIRLYSMDDNKVYNIELPYENITMLEKFENTLQMINSFDFDNFKQENKIKCERCIYNQLCCYSCV